MGFINIIEVMNSIQQNVKNLFFNLDIRLN